MFDVFIIFFLLIDFLNVLNFVDENLKFIVKKNKDIMVELFEDGNVVLDWDDIDILVFYD